MFANATAGVTGPIRVQVIGMDACSGSHFLGRGRQTEVARISKRGNSYLRRLFVQGARVVMQYRTKQAQGLSVWLSQLMARTHQNVAVVALANKLIRMA